MRSNFSKFVVAAIVAVTLLSGGKCHAVLLGYDGFDYAVGSNITGENGGSGWANAWSGSTPSATVGDRDVQSPGITYPALETLGNKAFISAANQTQRTFDQAFRGWAQRPFGSASSANEPVRTTFAFSV